MNKTKKKIVLSAVALFNEQGLFNVRNQDIAADAGISLSNFNYHFKTKEALVMAVCDYMNEILESKVYGNRLLIKEGQGLEIAKSYFEFELEFQFFYLDTYNIMKTFPGLKKEFQKQVQASIQMIKNLNYMAIGMGYMKAEPEAMPGLYDQLAVQIWTNNHFLFAQMNLRGVEGDLIKKGLEFSFSLLYPYLTEKGIEAHQKFNESLRSKAGEKVKK